MQRGSKSAYPNYNEKRLSHLQHNSRQSTQTDRSSNCPFDYVKWVLILQKKQWRIEHISTTEFGSDRWCLWPIQIQVPEAEYSITTRCDVIIPLKSNVSVSSVMRREEGNLFHQVFPRVWQVSQQWGNWPKRNSPLIKYHITHSNHSFSFSSRAVGLLLLAPSINACYLNIH